MLALSPTPNQEDEGVILCLVSTLRPFWHGWPFQEYKTHANIALGVIETRKLPHQDKVVTPFRATIILCSQKVTVNICSKLKTN